MKQVTVNKLFQDLFVASLRTEDNDPPVQKVLGSIPVEIRRELSADLMELLQEKVPHDGIEVVEPGGHALDEAQVNLAILKLRKEGMSKTVVFLRIKDVVAESIIPAVALGAAAVADPKLAIGLKILNLLKEVWDKLVVLTHAKDGAAIGAYEALASAISAKRATDGGFPTTAELHDRMPGMTVDVLKGALKRLADLGLIEVVKWGGAPSDLSDGGNGWGIRT